MTKLKNRKNWLKNSKIQWKLLWSERVNDKVRAEDISIANYESLRVERGTIIHATRDFKALNFKEILETHKVENPDRFVQPDYRVGGWSKFVKTEITCCQPSKNQQSARVPKKHEGQQPKKGGRGWLHTV